MTLRWRRAFHFPWRTPRRDVDAEIAFHFERRIADLVAGGALPEEARRRAADEFGDTDAVRADMLAIDSRLARRDAHARWWEQLWQDIRDALRGLRRAPGFAAITILTIGLGVGATSAVLTVSDALLLRPVPYPDAARVFTLRRESPTPDGWPSGPIPVQAFREYRDHARLVESAIPFQAFGDQPLLAGRDSITVRPAIVGQGFLGFAGIRPIAGRDFAPEEFTENGPGAVILSEQLWRRQFGGSRDVIGQVVQIDGKPHAVVGVVPASATLPDFRSERPEVWLPITPENDLLLHIAVRLKPGISREAATDEAAMYLKPSPLDKPWNRDIKWRIHMSQPDEKLKFRGALTMLTAAVALLLLLACANVAHLLIARGAVRERELAVRHALGANRGRLLRHLATESLLLGGIGGLVAIGAAWASLRLLAAARPASLGAPLSYASAGRSTIVLASVLAIAVGLGVGIISALRAAHRNLGQTLRSGAAGHSASGRLRAGLVVGEVGISATLLVGALLLIHAVFGLARTQVGFDERDLYTVTFFERPGESAESRAASGMQLRQDAERLAGAGNVTMKSPGFRFLVASFETPERPARGDTPGAGVSLVSADYFAAMHVPFRAGHTFDEGSAARHEVVISATLARTIWPGQDPIGQSFRNARSQVMAGTMEPWRTVIGVVPDAVTDLLRTEGDPFIYEPLPWRERLDRATTLFVRLPGVDAMPRLRAVAASVRPDQAGSPPTRFEKMRETLDVTMAEPRFTMGVLVAFAVVGVTLAAIGLFGVISYSVRRRTREIGVRMALGATRPVVARLVVGEALRLALAGIVLGLVGAAAGSRLLQGMLYGVERLDPFAFGVGALALLLVAVLACLAPMWRATGIDPIAATRAD